MSVTSKESGEEKEKIEGMGECQGARSALIELTAIRHVMRKVGQSLTGNQEIKLYF